MSETDPQFISCPACGQIIDVAGFAAGDSIECPHCHQTTAVADDSSQYAELDGSKIRQIATLRSATYRSRSHAVIATLVCVAATIESLAYLVRDLIHFGWSLQVIVQGAVAIAGIAGAIFFARRAMALNREVKTPNSWRR